MGSSHSNTIASTESILTAVVVAAAAAGGYVLYHNAHSQPSTTSNKSKPKPKTSKRKGGKSQDLASEAEKDAVAGSGPVVVPFPAVIPGDFGTASTAEESGPASSAGPEKRKKKKGKKAKKDVSTAPVGQPRAFIETASEDDSEVDATPIPEPAPAPSATKASKSKSKKSKKAKAEGTATPQPTTATTTSSQTQQKAPSPSAFATHLVPPEEERWTRVESRGKGKKRNVAAGSVTGGESGAETGGQGKDLTASARTMSASDAGITTSVTGTGGSSVEDEAESQSGEEYVHLFLRITLSRLNCTDSLWTI